MQMCIINVYVNYLLHVGLSSLSGGNFSVHKNLLDLRDLKIPKKIRLKSILSIYGKTIR